MGEMSQDEFAFGYILSRCNLKTTAPGNEKKWKNWADNYLTKKKMNWSNFTINRKKKSFPVEDPSTIL